MTNTDSTDSTDFTARAAQEIGFQMSKHGATEDDAKHAATMALNPEIEDELWDTVRNAASYGWRIGFNRTPRP